MSVVYSNLHLSVGCGEPLVTTGERMILTLSESTDLSLVFQVVNPQRKPFVAAIPPMPECEPHKISLQFSLPRDESTYHTVMWSQPCQFFCVQGWMKVMFQSSALCPSELRLLTEALSQQAFGNGTLP